MIKRRKIRHGYEFRHFGDNYEKKPGLYFTNKFWNPSEGYRLSEIEIVEIRDWLTRYINEYHLQTIPPVVTEMKAKARSIIRGLEQMEAQL